MKSLLSITRQTLLGLSLALAALSTNAQSLTDFAENKIVDALMRAQALGAPATFHAALFTAAAACDTGSVTEVTGGNYARQAVTSSLANWAGTQDPGSTTVSSGSGGQTSNNNAISWGTVTWAATVTHWGLYDAASAGNLWICAPLTVQQTVASGNTVQFGAGALTVTFQ